MRAYHMECPCAYVAYFTTCQRSIESSSALLPLIGPFQSGGFLIDKLLLLWCDDTISYPNSSRKEDHMFTPDGFFVEETGHAIACVVRSNRVYRACFHREGVVQIASDPFSRDPNILIRSLGDHLRSDWTSSYWFSRYGRRYRVPRGTLMVTSCIPHMVTPSELCPAYLVPSEDAVLFFSAHEAQEHIMHLCASLHQQ